MSIILRIQWSPGLLCTVMPTGPYPGRVKTGELVHTSQSQECLMKIEDKCYE